MKQKLIALSLFIVGFIGLIMSMNECEPGFINFIGLGFFGGSVSIWTMLNTHG
jgi:hypothetical protein